MPLPPPPDPALSDNQPSPRQSTHEDRPETSTSTPSSQHHSLSDPPLQSAPPDRSLVPKSRRGQWLTFVVWTQTGIEAIRLSLFVKHPLLRLLPAFVALPTTEAVQFWAIEHGTWVQEEPHRLPYAINEAARTVLVRYPGAFNCVGFTKALRMLEEERGTDVGPSEWDYVDLRSQYPLHEHGDQFTVVAYAQDQKPPTVFYVTLTRAGHLSWRLHTQLLRHILGTSAPDFQTFFHAWSPISQSWDAINPDDPFTPFHLHDFMVVRHKANSATPGLPRFLRLLDEQTLYPHNRFAVFPMLTDDAPAGKLPRITTGRTKDLWPPLTDTYIRILPRVTSLPTSAGSSSLPTSATKPTTSPHASASTSSAATTPRKRKSMANASQDTMTPLQRSTRLRQPKNMDPPSNVGEVASRRTKKAKTAVQM
ncbi:hypothetical protein LXA43DRAFT_1100750 [Ganoderma leucocontextum]|nr:hypothetical protein LXA43DRAFT_1100750 [Ganoderma leucocontextum]